MWVSLPDQMDSALHSYTRLQNNRASSADAPLESIQNWRQDFPYLDNVLQGPETDPFEVVLLGVNFQLMEDFPPRFSKLGISLELDFSHPRSDIQSLSELRDWSCTTHMYQHGQLIKVAQYDECHASSIGKVKPFFESKWWASTFTQLTENRKKAEDSKDPMAIMATNEAPDRFLRGLTVVQEIMAGPVREVIWGDKPPTKTRMAILLWKFAQAQDGYVGTTTWSKLMLPPNRFKLNSPVPVLELGLPPVVLETVVEDGSDFISGSNGRFLAEHNITMSSPYDAAMNGGFRSDGPLAFDEKDLASFTQPFEFALGVTDPQFEGGDTYMSVDHYTQLMFNVSQEMYSMQQNIQHRPSGNDRLSDLHCACSQPTVPTSQNLLQGQRADSIPRCDSTEPLPRRPLTSFDVNTHNMLQAQLGVGDDHWAASTAPARFSSPDPKTVNNAEAPVVDQRMTDGIYRLDAMDSSANPVSAAISDFSEQHRQIDRLYHNHKRWELNEQKQQQHWQRQCNIVAPTPTRPMLRSHASQLQYREPAQPGLSPIIEDLPTQDEPSTEGTSNIDMNPFDAESFAAVLSAHNQQPDQHYSRTEDGQRTVHDHRVDANGHQYINQHGQGDILGGLEFDATGDAPFTEETDR